MKALTLSELSLVLGVLALWFPELGEDEELSGADAVDRLNRLRDTLKAEINAKLEK